ncbi:MAG TPA: TonB-dependent receptor, partial [Phnomibacter sp.]|nr:TonB-dependent receptor [Phnomibacter sp.]
MLKRIFFLTLTSVACNALIGQEIENTDTLQGKEAMPQVNVVAYRDKLLGKVPGSVSVIKYKDISKVVPISGNDVLRKVPGLNIVEEEGAGMRINIGVRGLDPDRSRNVLMLEDGVPVALNPYGEPEMYFTPVIDKVRTVEVLKGSGQILFGPQTIGGVVNFITADPPQKATTEFRVRGGQGGYFSGYASHGHTVGNMGYHVGFLRKQADNIGPTRFHISDLSAKLRFRLSDRSTVGVKMGVYDELSNATYIGLTQAMYDAGGSDFARLAPHDRLPVRRYNLSVTHNMQWNPAVRLQTTAFAYTITRNWQRQDFAATPVSNGTGVVWGDPSVPGGAIYMRNSNGHRDRQFEVAGIEPRLKIKGSLAGRDHELQTGVRLLFEKAREQFVIGARADASSGTVRDNEIRRGMALSAYLNDELELTERLRLHAGVRLENFDY